MRGTIIPGGQRLPQHAKPLFGRALDERLAVAQQAIEEEHRERQLPPHRLDLQLAAEPPHRDLERMRRAVGPQCNRLAVENQRSAPQRAHGFHDSPALAR
jgi:hypothetical protein